MEATLIIVTLLSLALAIGMAIVTWRLLQEERQRTEARVAALEEGLAASLAANPPAPAAMSPATATPPAIALSSASSTSPSASAHAEPGESRPAMRAATRASEVSELAEYAEPSEVVDLHGTDDPDWLAQFPSSAAKVNGWSGTNGTKHNGSIARANGTSAIHVSSADADAGATVDRSNAASDADSFAADRLFTHDDAITRTSARSRGVLAMSVGAAVMVALIVALWSVGRLIAPGAADPRTDPRISTAPDARAGAGAGATAIAPSAPLELVALQQTREGETLTIHGVVRNPPAGATVDRLAAVVSFFDATGQQLTSVRAPLDFRMLAPGDESPFQVTTTVPAGVIRYRVSFRRDEGTIVPHVDRRQQEAS
jgi:hypothetical protein